MALQLLPSYFLRRDLSFRKTSKWVCDQASFTGVSWILIILSVHSTNVDDYG